VRIFRLARRVLIFGLAAVLLSVLGFAALDRAFPLDLSRLGDLSTVVLDRDGRPLKLFLNGAQAWRMPVIQFEGGIPVQAFAPDRTRALTIAMLYFALAGALNWIAHWYRDNQSQSAAQIAAASEQQRIGMDQVAMAMESIKIVTVQEVQGTRDLEIEAQNLYEAGQKLKRLVELVRM